MLLAKVRFCGKLVIRKPRINLTLHLERFLMLSQDGWHQKEALVNKRRWFIILAIFFLVQGITAPLIFSFESNSLNPAATLYLNYPEGRIEDPAIVFQVLPLLNEILSGCKIKPLYTYSTRQVDSSP